MLRRKLKYPPGTAGAIADPLVLALPEDQTVAEAQKNLHRSAARAYYYVYVVDREQRLVGALDLRELLLSQAKKTLSDVMRRELLRLPALSDLNTIVPSEPDQRLGGSIASHLLAVIDGADIVRTHDVAETMQALRVAAAIRSAR